MKPAARLLPLAVLLLAGCGVKRIFVPPPPPPPVSVHRTEALERKGRMRVLVLPFAHEDDVVAQDVTQAFALELEKAQAFEILNPYGPSRKILDNITILDNGALRVESLIALRRRFNVEGIVFGRVTSYRAYEPPILGLRVQVLSTRSGRVLWGASACYDARDDGVRALMKDFHHRYLDISERAYGWRILLDSPRHFAQFVSHQLVAEPEPPPPPPVVACTPKPN